MYRVYYFTPSNEDIERFDGFVKAIGGDVQQSSTGLFDVGPGLRYSFGAIKGSGLLLGDLTPLSLHIRRLPFGRSWLYCPRGPVWKEQDQAIWDTLFEQIRDIAKKERAIFLRIEPNEPSVLQVNVNEYRPVHSHAWSGITDFKLKFGGCIMRYHPAVEYVFQMPWYRFFLAAKRLGLVLKWLIFAVKKFSLTVKNLSFVAKKLTLAAKRLIFVEKMLTLATKKLGHRETHVVDHTFRQSLSLSYKKLSDFWKKNGFRLAHQHYQPEWTNMIDLSMSEEKILQQMKPKGRYNIRLAEKKGVKSLLWQWDRERELNDPTFLKAKEAGRVFFQLFQETTTRDGFRGHDVDYYTRFLMTAGDFDLGNLYIAYIPRGILKNEPQSFTNTTERYPLEKDVKNVHDKNVAYNAFSSSEKIFSQDIMEKIGGVPIAAIIVTHFGDRATYFYGASSNRHRDLMAPYFLQWTAMTDAKKYGSLWYDLFGIAPLEKV